MASMNRLRFLLGRNYFYWIAASLLLAGCFFLVETKNELSEKRMLSLKIQSQSALLSFYNALSYKEDLLRLKMELVDGVKMGRSPYKEKHIREENALIEQGEADIDKRKALIKSFQTERRFKMCILWTAAGVFFLAGVMRASKA